MNARSFIQTSFNSKLKTKILIMGDEFEINLGLEAPFKKFIRPNLNNNTGRDWMHNAITMSILHTSGLSTIY